MASSAAQLGTVGHPGGRRPIHESMVAAPAMG